MHDQRITRLRERMKTVRLDSYLVTNIRNVFYLTGFTGSTAAVIVTETSAAILVDPRYSIQARAECPAVEVIDYTGKSTIAAAAEALNSRAGSRVGFESQHMTIAAHRELRRQLDNRVRLRATSGWIEKLRRVKDSSEVALIRKAVHIADETFAAVVPQIRAGLTEKQIALLIENTLAELGAEKESFDTIAAAGANSALPHAHPGDTKLTRGDLFTMDYGAFYLRYASDITRTVCVGKPDSRQREVYAIVLEAQLKAIEAVRPGVKGRDVDAVARNHITECGYGDNFGHGLGHSLGIEVHDGPGFSVTSDITLEPGMVITVEPGIYIEGWGGVRIEDDVLVTDGGVEVLTTAVKDLLSV